MAYTPIDKSDEYFNTVLYNGSASTQNITGVNFQPDLVWIKTRSHAESHQLVDQVRGATKALMSNETSAEATYANGLSAFLSDGFTLPGGNNRYSDTGYTYASWNWLAGGTAVSNTDGSITSSVSANTTAGFSIVSYTGTGSTATVGHGLGTALAMIIAKTRDNGTISWVCYHQSLGANGIVQLNNTTAAQSVSGYWGTPNSTTFGLIGGGYDNNRSGENYIAYCFAEKKGYSKFGSFNGNGSADGTFVYTGFKPAFVMTKLSSGTGSWFLHDNKRNGYNGGNNYVYPNASDAELTTQLLDLTSNGFKMRFAGGANSSGTSIYMAFAENPLVTSGGTPTTAR